MAVTIAEKLKHIREASGHVFQLEDYDEAHECPYCQDKGRVYIVCVGGMPYAVECRRCYLRSEPAFGNEAIRNWNRLATKEARKIRDSINKTK